MIRAIFWDIGGVLLTNAWDHTERAEALEHFGLDAEEFRVRHEPLVPPFERGELSLDEYLDRTVFYRPQKFTPSEFKNYMFPLSKPFPDVLQFAGALTQSGKYFMATINNESRELNNYRIETFGLKNIFRVLFSSCYVARRKPDLDIYQLALDVTQFPASECCFIDDRAANLVPAAQLGMHTIEMKGLPELRAGLEKLSVTL
jgi:putative hydrolase of the HAD superfamily